MQLELERYRQIVVLTGAGVSVASGLRPYRGPDGWWTDHPEHREMATAKAARDDPMSTWNAFGSLRASVAKASPNPAHVALAKAEARRPAGTTLTVITQNIDGLHRDAGSSSVIELHGNLSRTRCSNPTCDLEPFEDRTVPETLPRCSRCDASLRPDIVLFDEPMAVRPEWESKQVLRDCDLFVAVGTSGTVSPAANFVRSAEYAGARTLFVNLEPLEPANPTFQETLLGAAESVLPQLFGVSET